MKQQWYGWTIHIPSIMSRTVDLCLLLHLETTGLEPVSPR